MSLLQLVTYPGYQRKNKTRDLTFAPILSLDYNWCFRLIKLKFSVWKRRPKAKQHTDKNRLMKNFGDNESTKLSSRKFPQYILVIKLSYNRNVSFHTFADSATGPSGFTWLSLNEIWTEWTLGKEKKKWWHLYARELNPSKVMFLNMLGQAPFTPVSHLFCTSQKQARRQEKLAFLCHTLHTVSRQKYGFRINGWFSSWKQEGEQQTSRVSKWDNGGGIKCSIPASFLIQICCQMVKKRGGKKLFYRQMAY